MNDTELARQRETDRRALRLQQQLLEFTPDALSGKIVEGDRRTDARALGFQCQLKARSKLQGTEDTEGVVCERARINHTEDTELEVFPPLEWIEIFAGERIPSDGIDGEVATPGGVLERHRRIASDRESLVPRPVFDSRRGSATSMSPSL